MLPTSRFVLKVEALPGAKLTVKGRELPEANVLGSSLKLKALFGLFVVIAIEIRSLGLSVVPLSFFRVNEIVDEEPTRVLPKKSGVALFACITLPSHCGVRLLLQDSQTCGAMPLPFKVAIGTTAPLIVAC